jgi:putative FmdB family regulatory protein
MPKYEYACKSCGEHLEVLQSFADAPLTECPACGGALRRVFSPPGIAFKGSGFYRTDNRKRRTEPKVDATADGSKTDAKTEGASEGKFDGKSDTKSDTKAEPAKKDSAASGEAKPKAAEAKTA